MLIVLGGIALISAGLLGFTYTKTKPLIDAVKKQKFENAIKEVLPPFDRLGKKYLVKGKGNEFDRLELYPAYKGDALAGTAVKSVTNKGFSGDIWVMVGITDDGTIFNTSVLDQHETPGLGTKMTPNLVPQVKGKNPASYKLKVKKDGGDVDAITAATISSRAFLDAVSKAVGAWKKGGKK
ncbi:RnfABCDGE type electron transport complex subunit G [bacterium]|nr:RnfABCDGE type electron transport complex subunit G [bacterium]